MYTIGVFATIFDEDDRVLLCHRRDYDVWNLPGGRLEDGEAPWDGVVREVKEETGLDVEVNCLTGVYSKPGRNDLVLHFDCSILGGQMHLSDEADQIRYFAVDEIPKNTIPKQVERLFDALDNPRKVHLKKQAGERTIELIKKGLL